MPADQPDHAKAAANLKDAGVILADQTKTGHGVNVDVSIAAALGRC
jgi:L-lysine 2,3-aminomutase